MVPYFNGSLVIITIHRGTHEIGGTCVEVTYDSSRIVLDLGMPLVKPGGGEGDEFNFKQHKDAAGVDLVAQGILPDVEGLYTWDTSPNRVDGVLISHAHLDHYGFTRFLHPEVACYLGEATKKLIDLTCLFTPAEVSINLKGTLFFSCSKPPPIQRTKPSNRVAFFVTGSLRWLRSTTRRATFARRLASRFGCSCSPIVPQCRIPPPPPAGFTVNLAAVPVQDGITLHSCATFFVPGRSLEVVSRTKD
ncbi:MAG: MBL fold metallo-hydrolase [Thermoanaerobaculales bacterium]|nr:MBL fold metallo-hydrolase [Thermoanaerobaculales bacterium]